MAKKMRRNHPGLKKPRTSAPSVPTPIPTAFPRVGLPQALKTAPDYREYTYISQDLKRIALITGLILSAYALIYLANSRLTLF